VRVIHVLKAKGIAGAERHLLDLLPGLRARDIDARCIVLTPPDGSGIPLSDAMRARGVPSESLVIERTLSRAVFGGLRQRFASEQPDIVHTHLIHADVLATLAARSVGIKRVVQSRHNDDPNFDKIHYKLLLGSLWRTVDAGICISEAVKRHTIKAEYAPAKKLHVIRYGYPQPLPSRDRVECRTRLRWEINAPADAPVLGMVCRLVEQKGIPDALDAFEKNCDFFSEARLVLAGDGILREALEARVDALGLNGRVHFLGWRPDALSVMAGLDGLLMPSLWEGFGMTLLEAMSQAIPIIGSTAGAIPEIVIDGQTGWVVPPSSPDALAAAIRQMLGDPERARQRGVAGQTRLKTVFTLDSMITATTALYRAL
jgi:glycosyltransferase involved in cell wall biosynthesis